MIFFKWISLFSSFTCIFIADIVYHSNKKSYMNRIFVHTSISTAIWSFSEFMCRQSENYTTALFWAKVGFIVPFCLAFFLHFVLLFTEHYKLLKKKLTFVLLYLPSAFFIILQILTNRVSGVPVKQPWGYSTYSIPSDPLLFYIYEVWIISIALLIIYFLIRFFRNTTTPVKKAQTRYFIIGFIPPFLLGLVEIIFKLCNLKNPELTTIMLTWLNVCIGYAMWKYDLFSLGLNTAAENIIATMPDALLLINSYNQITRINDSFSQLSGYSGKEIYGKSLDHFFKDDQSVTELKQALHKSKTVINTEVCVVTASGRLIPALLSGSVIKNKRYDIVGFVIILRDITERKNAEEHLVKLTDELQKSNKELQDFTHIASHDLKEPLRKIRVFANYLKVNYSDLLDKDGKDYIWRMEHAAIRMQSLIEGLLTYSRVTTKASPFVEVDPVQVIKEVMLDLEILLDETSGKIELGTLPLLYADPLQMRQLFQNIIGNALKYHKKDKPPQIIISGSVKEKSAEIIVSDNGIGFDQVYGETVFGIFQRLVGKNEYEGTGIGLSICKKIIERHKGTIRAISTPGEGTSIILNLPRYEKT